MTDSKHLFNIVMVEPEIPPNTGNVARTCAATSTKLHLVEPLGFSIDDKHLKRAGLDYWSYVDIELHSSLNAFIEKYGNKPIYPATTKAAKKYTDVKYEEGAFIVFGKETKGLPQTLIDAYFENAIRIPMGRETNLRSLNLANSVNIILFEALRQKNFRGLF